MNKQKMLYSMILIYLGVLFLVFPIVLMETYYTPLFTSCGLLCIFLGFLLFLYNKLCQKIDTISNHVSNMNAIGIEQIIPADSDIYSFLEKLAYKSNNVKIIINIYRLTDRFCYFLNSLIENKWINFQIMIIGQSDDPKKQYFVEDLCKRQKNHVTIKTSENPQIDNLLIFDEKSCIMNYDNYDNKISFIILFSAFCENNRENRKLFEFLWNDEKLTSE